MYLKSPVSEYLDGTERNKERSVVTMHRYLTQDEEERKRHLGWLNSMKNYRETEDLIFVEASSFSRKLPEFASERSLELAERIESAIEDLDKYRKREHQPPISDEKKEWARNSLHKVFAEFF